MSDHFDYHMVYSKQDPEPMAPIESLYRDMGLPSPTFDSPMTLDNRRFLTIRTPEESLYLLSLLPQPPPAPQPLLSHSRYFNQYQKPVLATATHNYGAIGRKVDSSEAYERAPASQSSGSDASNDTHTREAPHQHRKKRHTRSHNKKNIHHVHNDTRSHNKKNIHHVHNDTTQYSGHTVYFNQTSHEDRTNAMGPTGRNNTVFRPTLKVTKAKTNAVVFRDEYGNFITAVQGRPVMHFE